MSHHNAYHVVVNALEARAGWTPPKRFASIIASTINGHLPYQRYHAAGMARQREGATDSTVEREVREWLQWDANPGNQILGGLTDIGNALAASNAYLKAAPLGVRSRLLPPGHGPRAQGLSMLRSISPTVTDPMLCQAGVLLAFETLLGTVRSNSMRPLPPTVRRLSAFAQGLGVTDLAAAELAAVFEQEGSMPIRLAARHLGCHQRTMERRLREEGVTAEAIRQAARLLEASARLRSAASLTTIAVETGFSDLAHMSRAFRTSCGQSPSLLRASAKGLLVPEDGLSA